MSPVLKAGVSNKGGPCKPRPKGVMKSHITTPRTVLPVDLSMLLAKRYPLFPPYDSVNTTNSSGSHSWSTAPVSISTDSKGFCSANLWPRSIWEKLSCGQPAKSIPAKVRVVRPIRKAPENATSFAAPVFSATSHRTSLRRFVCCVHCVRCVRAVVARG